MVSLCWEVSKSLHNIPLTCPKLMAVFLDKVIESFGQHTPMVSECPRTKALVSLAFIKQVAPDNKRKFQRIERLGENSMEILVMWQRKCLMGERMQKNR